MNPIRMYREKNGMTQEKLGEMLGVTRVAVTQWERGENVPRPGTLLKLSQIFNCSIEDLLHLET